MWGFNDWVKLCSQCLISLHVLTGLLFVGYGLYVVLRPWGNAEKDVYQAIGACLVLFGTCLTTVSVFGFEAIGAQVKRFGKGWTGRSAIAAYSLFLVALFVAIVFLYEYGTDLLSSMHDTIEELKADSASNPSYSEFENAISSRFNAMFFTVVSNCGEKYSWFWVFVENYCPNTMGQRDCERCASYSVSFCIADENTCYGTSPAGENFACPFHLCRQQTLQFVYDLIIDYFELVMYAAAGVTLCIILLSIPLIRYSQTKKMSIHITEGGDEEGMEIELAGADAGRPEGTGNPNDFYKTSESGGDVAPSSGRLSPSSPHSREASRSNSPHPTGNFSGTSPHQHHQHEQLQQQQGNTYEDALIASFIEANEGSLRTQRPPNVEDNKNIPTDAEMEIAIMESLELQAKMQSRDEEDLQLAILQSVRTSSLQRNRQYQALTTQSSSKTNAHHAEQQQDQQKLQQRQSVQVKAQSQLGPEQGQERGHGQEQGQGQEQQSSRSGVRSLRVTNPPSPLSGASPPTAAMGFERVSTKIDGDSPL